MALDSARKRKSAAWVGQVFSPPTIAPDGSIGQADRQTAGWGYYGILATSAVASTVTGRARVLEGYSSRVVEGYALRVVEHS